MSRVFQSRTAKWLAAAFVVGAAGGFLWALNRPHGPSPYRAQLDEERVRAGQG